MSFRLFTHTMGSCMIRKASHAKVLLLLVVMLIVATSNSFAQASFETIDGIRYLIDYNAKIAAVVPLSGDQKYWGDIVVSEKVKAKDGMEYPVTAFGENAFNGCTSLTRITIPSSVTSLGNNCFYNCYNLTNSTIPSSITSLGDDCFYHCNSLSSIAIPSSVTVLGNHCFWDCSSLTSITIPSSVTALGVGCFGYCSSLTNIAIPSSVEKIGYKCFELCSKLESVTFKGECPTNTIDSEIPITSILYVPKQYLQSYKDALGSKYSYIYASTEEGEDTPVKTCATPTITYADGELQFASATEGVQYHYTITDADMANDAFSKGKVQLSAAYNISAYATAEGYKPSEKATAVLYWVKANGNLENNPSTNINQAKTRGIIATSHDGIVTLSGLDNGEEVRFYSVDGKQIGYARAIDGVASLAVSENLVIAKIGNQPIKIAVK